MKHYSERSKEFQKKREREAALRLEINKRKPWLRNAQSFRVLAEDLKDLGFYSKGTSVQDVEKILKRGYDSGRFRE